MCISKKVNNFEIIYTMIQYANKKDRSEIISKRFIEYKVEFLIQLLELFTLKITAIRTSFI